jgi:hypothetical protein
MNIRFLVAEYALVVVAALALLSFAVAASP